jgi:hypothetical protein
VQFSFNFCSIIFPTFSRLCHLFPRPFVFCFSPSLFFFFFFFFFFLCLSFSLIVLSMIFPILYHTARQYALFSNIISLLFHCLERTLSFYFFIYLFFHGFGYDFIYYIIRQGNMKEFIIFFDNIVRVYCCGKASSFDRFCCT